MGPLYEADVGCDKPEGVTLENKECEQEKRDDPEADAEDAGAGRETLRNRLSRVQKPREKKLGR